VSGPSTREEVKQALERLGFAVEEARDVLRVRLEPADLRKAAEELLRLGFDHLASVGGVDWPAEGKIEVVYHAESYELGKRSFLVELRVKVPRDDPHLPSLIDVWPNALLMEREVWEMLGVTFEGNPDLRRLLLPPDWSGPPPLRKDFRVEEEGIYVEYE